MPILSSRFAPPIVAMLLALAPLATAVGQTTTPAFTASASVPADSAGAQQAPHPTGSTPDSSAVRLFTPRDAAVMVGVGAAVAALMPADRSIAHAFQRPGLQSNGAIKATLNVFNGMGDPGVIIFSAVTYFAGLGTHSRPVAALGMHTGEAIVMGGVITEMLKGSFGRARPYVNVTNPHDFNPGKGFSSDDYTSFPSGDVTLAFAAATAASREVARSWPDAARYVTPASYAGATLVGIARMYKNKHWASDVVAGAGVGTLSGVLFDRFNRAYPHNVFNRVFLPASIVPEHGGAQLSWSIPLPGPPVGRDASPVGAP